LESYGAGVSGYAFTGEMYDSQTGLVYLRARYYAPYLNQFVQPDTIIPEPANAANWNRYAYTNYNPIRYSDPSGHTGEDPGDDDPFAYLYQYAAEQLMRVANNEISDLEAMALIVDESAIVYDGDLDQMMPTLSSIFLGTPQTGTTGLISPVINNKLFDGGCDGVGRSKHDCDGNQYSFGDSGFHEDFRDEDNQIFHFWGYIAQTYSNPFFVGLNTTIGVGGNLFHEIVQSSLNIDDGWGTSWNDYVLSDVGMYTGIQLSKGEISGHEFGDFLRRRLGTNGPGSRGKLEKSLERWGALKGMDQYGN